MHIKLKAMEIICQLPWNKRVKQTSHNASNTMIITKKSNTIPVSGTYLYSPIHTLELAGKDLKLDLLKLSQNRNKARTRVEEGTFVDCFCWVLEL